MTHCDNLMQEKQGIVHINMTDLLQQYAIGNGKLQILINLTYKMHKKQSLLTLYVSCCRRLRKSA